MNRILDLCHLALFGIERGETTIVVHRRWYHFWRLGNVLVVPAATVAWLFGRLSVSAGSRETVYYFR